MGDVTTSEDGTTYTTSNENIATVGIDGLVTGTGPGTAIISARNDGTLSTVIVNVAGGDDSDGDGIPDDYEVANGLNPNDPNDAGLDPYSDGLTNLEEFQAGTLAQVADTDGDGLNDGGEIANNTNPFNPDTDGDDLFDGDEIAAGSNPLAADTDGDGLEDGVEVALGLSPTSTDTDGNGTNDFDEDTDGDALSNGDEIAILTDPTNPDTDGDGFQDGFEVFTGCNPIVDELTEVVGTTLDNLSNPVENALIEIVGKQDKTGVSNITGNFSITDTQACPPLVQASATANINGQSFKGLSQSVLSNVGGATNVGDIILQPLIGVLYNGYKVPVGLSPNEVVLADLNLDSVLDLVTAIRAGGGANTVSIKLGIGDGTFGNDMGFSAGTFADGVAIADINSDNLPDMILTVSNSGSVFGQVFSYLGNGDGTFAFVEDKITSSDTIEHTAVGDLNGDTFPDLVVSALSTGSVLVYLGNGNGTFQAEQSFPTGSQPKESDIGDLNGDSIPDIAVAAFNRLSVLFGNGDGTFQPEQTMASNNNYSVKITDIDNDTNNDIVAARDISFSSGSMIVFRGNGDGTFQAGQVALAGNRSRSVSLGDLNGDNVLDAVLANIFEDSISSVLGNGDGTFQPRMNYPVDGPISVNLGDLDGDGLLDIAAATGGASQSTTSSVLFGNGNGTFDGPIFGVQVGTDATEGVAIADFNGDSVPDVATANSRLGVASGGSIGVILGNGNGTFQPRQNFTAGNQPSAIVAADFNGDSIVDLAVSNNASSDVSILLGNGDGTFGAAQSFAVGNAPRAIAVADFNGDAILDLATPSYSTDFVTVLLGNGDGTFVTQQILSTTAPGIAVGDFNGDQFPDIVASNNSFGGSVAVNLGNGDGTFQARQFFAAGQRPISVAAGDIDSDGNDDIAVSNDQSDDVSVLFSNGNGTFQPQIFLPNGGGLQDIRVEDLNGDGIADIAVANQTTMDFSVYVSNGDRTFRPEQRYTTFYGNPRSIAFGDLNGDGSTDCVAGIVNFNDVLIQLHK